MFLILNYFFNGWEYQACILQLPWLLEEVDYISIPSPSHITNTHELYWSARKLAGLGRASALVWMHLPAYNATGAG